jgi:hypothetical protein
MTPPASASKPTGEVRQIQVPAASRALSTLDRIHYADAFVVEAGSTQKRTAEGWARAIFDDAPLALRTSLLSGWSALGFKLSLPPAQGSVLGWPIKRSDPDFVLLGSESRLGMSAELLLRREPNALLFSTLLQLRNPMVRAVWAVVEPRHVPIVQRVLQLASSRWSA